jgi:uncharacterized protein
VIFRPNSSAWEKIMAKSQGVALVTGTSSGIGAVFADRLARRGYDLIVVARRRDRLEQQAARLRSETGVRIEVLAADLADPADLRRVEDRLAGEANLTMLVNNAAIGGMGPFDEISREDVASMIAVNVLAVAQLCRAAVPVLIKNRGVIINVSSGASFGSMKGSAIYSGTKAFVTHFTRTLHEEVGELGVRLQALIPGLTRTELGGDPKFFDQFPPEWVMSPEDLVDASLVGLEMGELICIPAVAEISDFEQAHAVVQKIGLSVSHSDPAPRYLQAQR